MVARTGCNLNWALTVKGIPRKEYSLYIYPFDDIKIYESFESVRVAIDMYSF